MGYTIIEHLESAGKSQKRSIGTYDCAYEAVDAIRAALQKKSERVWGWYLVDEVGTVLFGPTDLAAIVAESDEFEASSAEVLDPAGSGAPIEQGRRKERHASGLLSDSDLIWD